MQYQFNERFEYVKTIEFLNSNPLVNVTRIRYYREEGVTGAFVKKEFRYSFDNATWTNWNTLSQANLANIQFRDNPSFYLQLKYTRVGIGSGNIQRFYVFYDSSTPTPPAPTPDASIDATTLQGEGPAYYLDRANHEGPYTDLIFSNVVDGSTIGVWHQTVDTSFNTEVFFKRIEGIGGVTVTESSSGIISIDVDTSTIIGDVTYQNPDPTIEAVGGIPDGSTYFASEKTFAQVMEDMFYPLAFPNLTNPYNTLTDNVAPPDLVIIGTPISLNLISTLYRGTINPAYGTDGYRSGTGISVHFNGPDVSAGISSSGPSHTYNIPSYEVSIGYQTWYSNWDVSDGQQPLDSKGNDYLSPYPAQFLTPYSTRFEGVYPIYATTNNITTPTKQDLVSMIVGDNIEMQMVAEPPFGTDRQKFDIPDVWLSSRPLMGVQFYSDLESAWKYEGDSSTSSLTYWTDSSVSYFTPATGNVPYTRYSYNSPDKQGAVLYRLNFS